MASKPVLADLDLDVWSLIFEQLTNHPRSLCSVSLTCKGWRSLSLPFLLRIVDLSSHNNGRVPEHECNIRPVVYANEGGRYRQRDLIPRQRAFLRLITAKPGLAKYVRSFTWTLIWMDFGERYLTDIDRTTWNVFAQLTNVTHLDLASLHEVCENEHDYVRRNPSRLFPAVTDLRLLGWMHRGLVKAIITSLDSDRLRSVKLDYLVDEGALPDGSTLDETTTEDYAHTSRRIYSSELDSSDIINETLLQLQEAGEICIFPGPNWFALRLLSSRPLSSLEHLEVKLVHFDYDTDLRNYCTMFQDTANVMVQARQSLTSLVVVFGESSEAFDEYRITNCGTTRRRLKFEFRPWCIMLAATFLKRLVEALSQVSFPRLESIDFEGFHILEDACPREFSDAQLSSVFQTIQDCPFNTGNFTKVPSLDYRCAFNGYENATPDVDRYMDVLIRS